MTPDRTAAAIEARRRAAEQKLQQVRDAIASLRRHKAPVTYPAVARAAGVSRTFLYANPEARALTSEAVSKDGRRKAPAPGTGGDQEPSWRERALNAEAALKTAHAEIAAQRRRMAILLGQIRDLEHDLSPEAAQRLATENPRSSSAPASSHKTTGPWRNGWKPPAPTTASLTGASPSSKPSSPSAHQPADRIHLTRPRHRSRGVPATFTSRTCTRRESPGQNLVNSPNGRKSGRGPRLQEPAHRLQHHRRRDRRLDAGVGPGHEDRLPAAAQRSPGGDVRHRHPDRELGHRGVRDAAVPGPTCSRPPGYRCSTPGRPPSARSSRRSSWHPRAATASGSRAGSPGSATSRRCSACGTCSPTSRPRPTCACPSPGWRRGPPTAAARPRPSRSRRRKSWSATSPTSAGGLRRSAPGPSPRRTTTCSRSPETAAAPPWTCAWPACRRPFPARSPRPPAGSARSGTPTATTGTRPRTARRTRCAGRCSWCSATWEPPDRGGTPTASSARCSPPAGFPASPSGSCTRRSPTPTWPACSPRAGPGTSPC